MFRPDKLRQEKSTIEITSKEVRGNDVNFAINKITSKQYVEMTWKFVEIWTLTYLGDIDVESMWIRRGVPVENNLEYMSRKPITVQNHLGLKTFGN